MLRHNPRQGVATPLATPLAAPLAALEVAPTHNQYLRTPRHALSANTTLKTRVGAGLSRDKPRSSKSLLGRQLGRHQSLSPEEAVHARYSTCRSIQSTLRPRRITGPVQAAHTKASHTKATHTQAVHMQAAHTTNHRWDGVGWGRDGAEGKTTPAVSKVPTTEGVEGGWTQGGALMQSWDRSEKFAGDKSTGDKPTGVKSTGDKSASEGSAGINCVVDTSRGGRAEARALLLTSKRPRWLPPPPTDAILARSAASGGASDQSSGVGQLDNTLTPDANPDPDFNPDLNPGLTPRVTLVSVGFGDATVSRARERYRKQAPK